MKWVILLLLSISAYANDIKKLPKSFAIGRGQAVFVDFKTAHYNITYDVKKKEVRARAEIVFESAEAGFPIFDSVVAPTKILLDKKPITATLETTPQKETQLRVLDSSTTPGLHTLIIELPILEYFEFSDTDVKHGLWMGDLRDRDYLERFLPANLLFDRVAMTIRAKIMGAKEAHTIFTNGILETLAENEFKITYPDYFTSSCLFYHLVPNHSVFTDHFSFRSLSGQDVPVTVYMRSTDDITLFEQYKKATLNILSELESDYGAYPHPSLTIYVAPEGGMEYAGATASALDALGHELFHTYFARGFMPADGNAGWIDEGLAVWRDQGYFSLQTLEGTSGLASHPPYTRATDRGAYGFGSRFFAHLNAKTGGLRPFLKELVSLNAFAPHTVNDFIKAMGNYFSQDFTPIFQQYVFSAQKTKDHAASPVHRRFTHKELMDLL